MASYVALRLDFLRQQHKQMNNPQSATARRSPPPAAIPGEREGGQRSWWEFKGHVGTYTGILCLVRFIDVDCLLGQEGWVATSTRGLPVAHNYCMIFECKFKGHAIISRKPSGS